MNTPAVARSRVRPPRQANRNRERIFFGFMALLIMATIILGFRATYFPLGPKPTALASPIIVPHGTVFSTFLAFFLMQVALVTAKKVRWHMKLGLWLFCLAAVMVPVGVLAAADEIKRDLAAGPPYTLGVDPVSFSIVSVNGMLMFGSLMAVSYLWRRNPAAHKRLALYAVISMTNAGSDRWPWHAWGISETWSVWFYTLLLVLPIVYDLIALHRVHTATRFAASYVWLLYTFQIPFGKTAA
ncbi:MAG TPA: hypothetical protein VIY49_08260 [Bryobacteraceae bacterium]